MPFCVALLLGWKNWFAGRYMFGLLKNSSVEAIAPTLPLKTCCETRMAKNSRHVCFFFSMNFIGNVTFSLVIIKINAVDRSKLSLESAKTVLFRTNLPQRGKISQHVVNREGTLQNNLFARGWKRQHR